MKKTLIIGCDPSSAKLAVVITMEGDPLIDYRTTLLKKGSRPHACAQAYEFIEEISEDYDKAKLIMFMEAPFIMRTAPNGVIPQAMISGAVQAACAHRSIPVHLIPVMTWKKESVGKGTASKEDVRAWVKETWPVAYELFGKDQDLMDAAGLNRYGARVMRRKAAQEGI